VRFLGYTSRTTAGKDIEPETMKLVRRLLELTWLSALGIALWRPRQSISHCPGELADESAWVWACGLSGTFWYYAHKPAHKLTSANVETRELVFKFVQSSGEPQYVVNDDPSCRRCWMRLFNWAARLSTWGEVDRYPYYLIHWPSH